MAGLNALTKISYGLYLLTAREGEKENGCIINTPVQITGDPEVISIAVNKRNYTHDMILRTGDFDLSVLTEKVPFSFFQRFGFQSGRDTDKFAGFYPVLLSANGLPYAPEFANAFISGRVKAALDQGTHTLFLADVTESAVLSDDPSVTYAYYFAHIKPKPAEAPRKKGFVCNICGYIYEGEELPPDFVCPICKHGAADFSPIG